VQALKKRGGTTCEAEEDSTAAAVIPAGAKSVTKSATPAAESIPTAAKSVTESGTTAAAESIPTVAKSATESAAKCVTDEPRKKIPKEIPNKYNFFGTVTSRGKNKGSWNIKWGVLPVD